MILFLCSSAFTDDSSQINPENGFLDRLRASLPSSPVHLLYITSSPDDSEVNDVYSAITRAAFLRSGFDLADFQLLDRRSFDKADEWIRSADLIFLSGGHVPTQNAFFEELKLRTLLHNFEGVIVGSSAGSMNTATTVYSQPELPGEAIDPNYKRWLKGLGLCDINILPHLQLLRHESVDSLRIIEDIAFEDSFRIPLYALPDGSYIEIDGKVEIHGEAYRIFQGKMQKL